MFVLNSEIIFGGSRTKDGPFSVKKNTTAAYLESPKGEFGVIVSSDDSNKPLTCKIRSPSYFNLQALPKLAKGHYLSDLAAIIGTIDIVFGEIDR